MNLKRAIGGPLLSIAFLIFFAYMIFGVQWIFDNSIQNQNKDEFLGSISDSMQNITLSTPELEINVKSAVSVESNLQDINKILFAKDSDIQLPIASLTKLMTAVVVLDNYNLSDTWQVDEVADSQEPMKQDVKLGDTLTVESFLEIMLVESSNKSAYALSELVGEKKFIELMNQKTKDLGLQKTFFADPTGLSPENVSTVNDLTKLAEYILRNYPKIAEISMTKAFYVQDFGNVINTDQLLGEVPGVVFGKTGFTKEANGCLLLVIKNPKDGNYLINVILGADDRFSEMKNLINWSNAANN